LLGCLLTFTLGLACLLAFFHAWSCLLACFHFVILLSIHCSLTTENNFVRLQDSPKKTAGTICFDVSETVPKTGVLSFRQLSDGRKRLRFNPRQHKTENPRAHPVQRFEPEKSTETSYFDVSCFKRKSPTFPKNVTFRLKVDSLFDTKVLVVRAARNEIGISPHHSGVLLRLPMNLLRFFFFCHHGGERSPSSP
jgi:hypothetical protein